jgi:hypothetical protein
MSGAPANRTDSFAAGGADRPVSYRGEERHPYADARPAPPTAPMPAYGHPSFDPVSSGPESSWFTSTATHSVEQAAQNAPFAQPDDPFPSNASYPSFATGPGPEPQPSSNEFLPIFASVEESSWFTKSAPTADRRDPAWSSPADQGWQAATTAAEPAKNGTTDSGLPKRTPRANLVPGTAVPQPPPAPVPPLSPDRLRNRLASYQQGVRKGRAELEED